MDALRGTVARATIPWYLSSSAASSALGVFAFFSIRSFHAVRSAPAIKSSLACASRMCVDPFLPQPPGIGRKTSGCSCNELGLKFRREHQVAVALAFPKRALRISCRRRGSQAEPMCEPSSAPGRLSASRRKSATVMAASIPYVIGAPPVDRGTLDPARLGRAVAVTYLVERPLLRWTAPPARRKLAPTAQLALECAGLAATGWIMGRWATLDVLDIRRDVGRLELRAGPHRPPMAVPVAAGFIQNRAIWNRSSRP